MNKIDFTDKNFIFISRPDQYFLEGQPAELDTDCSTWNKNMIIEDGWGFFNGLTMVTYKGFDGKLPRMDGDTSSFCEFNIYYKDVLVNEMTYDGLYNLINRDTELNKIL